MQKKQDTQARRPSIEEMPPLKKQKLSHVYDDLTGWIGMFCQFEELCNMQLVNRNWNALLNTAKFWQKYYENFTEQTSMFADQCNSDFAELAQRKLSLFAYNYAGQNVMHLMKKVNNVMRFDSERCKVALLDKYEILPFVAVVAMRKFHDAAANIIGMLAVMFENSKTEEAQVDVLLALLVFNNSDLTAHMKNHRDMLLTININSASSNNEIVRNMMVFQLLVSTEANISGDTIFSLWKLICNAISHQQDDSLLDRATMLFAFILKLMANDANLISLIDSQLINKLAFHATSSNCPSLQFNSFTALQLVSKKNPDSLCTVAAVVDELVQSTSYLLKNRALLLLTTLVKVGGTKHVAELEKLKVFDFMIGIYDSKKTSCEHRIFAVHSIAGGCELKTVRQRLWHLHKDLLTKNLTSTIYTAASMLAQGTKLPSKQITLLQCSFDLIFQLFTLPEAAKRIASSEFVCELLHFLNEPGLGVVLKLVSFLFAIMPEVYSTNVALQIMQSLFNIENKYECDKVALDGCIACNKLCDALMFCNCNRAAYCSQECQAHHWESHKSFCRQ